MNGGRRGAFVLLVVTVLCSVLPAATCLLHSGLMGQQVCCKAMAPDCPMQGSEMRASCCQMRSEQTAVVADTPILPEHGNSPALPFDVVEPVSQVITTDAGWHRGQEACPETPPGANSILRI